MGKERSTLESLEVKIMFSNIYSGKKVLVTGHTGFKGTWLTCWLLELGAKVVGISKDIPTEPSMFNEMGLASKITHHILDVRELDKIKEVFVKEKPDFVFHLAAQAIVSTSYSNPLETIQTNVMGTANVLECLRSFTHKCTAIVITSDKCYENVEWCWGYKETDHMGGKDIYSASKGAAELIFHSYQMSFFNSPDSKVRLASARAGNVIGGGDWAADRIVADCVRSWSKGQAVEIRSPNATRPWQHVLEPLSGYLALGEALDLNPKLHGESFNFGPRAEVNHTVEEVLRDLSTYWDFNSPSDSYKVVENRPFNEAGLLKLNCDKAVFFLKWQATLNYNKTVKFVSEWYYKFYRNKEESIYDFTLGQIRQYESFAKEERIKWALQ